VGDLASCSALAVVLLPNISKFIAIRENPGLRSSVARNLPL
jgi:hypothetical protein